MKKRWGPFADLDIADQVLAVAGGPAAVLERLVAAPPVVRCEACGQQASIASDALSLIAQLTATDPVGFGPVRLSFAHQRCLPSATILAPSAVAHHLADEDDVDVARVLRTAPPTAAVVWEPGGRAYFEAIAGGDSRDLLVSGLLAQGWTLLAGDPQTVSLPALVGWEVIVSGHQLTLYGPLGDRLFRKVAVPPLAGWQAAVEAEGHCALITGTGIGLRAGEPGLLAAIQRGSAVGAVAVTSPVDEREYVYIFRLQWHSQGKVPRFVVDGRRYGHPDAVRSICQEARRELSRLGIPVQVQAQPVTPTQPGPLLPTWDEFRPRLTTLRAEEPPP
jgi:hypothetical protein